MAQDYKKTLNLPETEFAMQAGLPKREPVMLEQWEKDGIYETLMKKNEESPCSFCTMARRMQTVTFIWARRSTRR